jgi:hypothetical protein
MGQNTAIEKVPDKSSQVQFVGNSLRIIPKIDPLHSAFHNDFVTTVHTAKLHNLKQIVFCIAGAFRNAKDGLRLELLLSFCKSSIFI